MAKGRRKNKRQGRQREKKPFDVSEWSPKTELGRKVKRKEIVNIDEIFELGKPILEHEIVDALIPNLQEDIVEVAMTQRTTDCGRKASYRAVALVGDNNGHVGIGVGKSVEAKPAIVSAIKYAKRNIIKVPISCGSWECGCGGRHSVPINTTGKCASVKVTLKPAPRGLGLAAPGVVKQVLSFAGVKDAWTFSRGKTSSKLNTARATVDALDKLNKMKVKGSWETKNVKGDVSA